jgi:hypothetical protein
VEGGKCGIISGATGNGAPLGFRSRGNACPVISKLTRVRSTEMISTLTRYPPRASASFPLELHLHSLIKSTHQIIPYKAWRIPQRRLHHLRPIVELPRVDPSTLPSSDDEPFDIALPLEYFESYRCGLPGAQVSVTKKQLLDMYLEMVKMRRLEIKADELYRQKKIRGFCHLAIGQEAVYVGMENAMTRKDLVIGAYRIHTLAAQRGETMRAVFAELLGKPDSWPFFVDS